MLRTFFFRETFPGPHQRHVQLAEQIFVWKHFSSCFDFYSRRVVEGDESPRARDSDSVSTCISSFCCFICEAGGIAARTSVINKRLLIIISGRAATHKKKRSGREKTVGELMHNWRAAKFSTALLARRHNFFWVCSFARSNWSSKLYLLFSSWAVIFDYCNRLELLSSPSPWDDLEREFLIRCERGHRIMAEGEDSKEIS